jgi:hypothetical protein
MLRRTVLVASLIASVGLIQAPRVAAEQNSTSVPVTVPLKGDQQAKVVIECASGGLESQTNDTVGSYSTCQLAKPVNYPLANGKEVKCAPDQKIAIYPNGALYGCFTADDDANIFETKKGAPIPCAAVPAWFSPEGALSLCGGSRY